jgi:hypothetical protein
VQVEALRCHGVRTMAQLVKGEEPGPMAAPFKLLWSEYHKAVTTLAVDVLGLDGLTPADSPQAQRNIVGELLLGLPKEPKPIKLAVRWPYFPSHRHREFPRTIVSTGSCIGVRLCP